MITLEMWTSYFAELFNVDTAGTNIGLVVPQIMGEHREVAHDWLSHPLSEEEIYRTLSTLRRGSAPGLDGIACEWVRYGAYDERSPLVVSLTSVFNKVLTGAYPIQWAASALVPVPKGKGVSTDRDNYRGIAVGSAFGKIFSLCLLDRLDDWAEQFELRAEGQYGFRKERGTIEASFVLNTLIDEYRNIKRPLYVAFVDFRKAYDGISRDALWECLSRLGVCDSYLRVLKAMYDIVALRVRSNGNMGPEFSSRVGVKQGDPLSPLLFGLFIDRIEAFLRTEMPHVGAKLRGLIIQLLLYADDLTLLADSPRELQQLLDALLRFSTAVGLTVNIKKSEIVIYNKEFHTSQQSFVFNYNGQPLEVRDSFVYLGSLLCDGTTDYRAKNAFEYRMMKAKRALFLMQGRCQTLGIHNVDTRLHLLDSLVMSVLNSGCEVWCPMLLNDITILEDHQCEKWHRSALKHILGLPKSTTTYVLMEELDRLPVAFVWMKLALGFWNRVVQKNEDDYAYVAMSAALDSNNGWVKRMSRALARWGVFNIMDTMEKVDVEDVMDKVVKTWKSKTYIPDCTLQIREIPEEISKGFKTLKYIRWFSVHPDVAKHTKFTSMLHRFDHINVVAKFRMGCHWLKCEERVVDRIKIPRSQRLCTLCDFHKCEDEMHIFECPFYNDIRLKFQQLFKHICCDNYQNNNMTIWSWNFSDDNFRQFMNGYQDPSFWLDLAFFLIACRKKRKAGLRALAAQNSLSSSSLDEA